MASTGDEVDTRRVTEPPDEESPRVDGPRDAPRPEPDPGVEADVHAFLIADMRGWTAFTQERGDEEAARLAARFADLTRSVVEDHRGRVLELRGDEALVVFGSPRSAIRGAVALQQRFVEETIADPALPLTVGMGLDAGEAVPVEGGYRGGALNVAGRLVSRARAGEVLASREIVHLARHIDGIRFTERGPADLKGLDQPVQVVAVRSEDRDAVEALAPFVRTTAPATHRERRRLAVAAVAFVVLAAAIAVPLIVRRAEGSSEIPPNSIGILDPESGELVTDIALSERPASMASSANDVWIAHPDDGSVTQVDIADKDARDSIAVGDNPTGIAIGEDAVWVVDSAGPNVARISIDTNDVVDTIPVGNGPAGITVGEGSVWVTNRFDGTVSRIDPDPSGQVETVSVGADPRGIVFGFDSIWVALAGSNTVARLDPATNTVTQAIGVGNAPGALAVGGDAVWVVNSLDDTVSRIDPGTNSVVNTIEVGSGPSSVIVSDGVVWVANANDGSLSRIEPGGPSIRHIAVGSVPEGMVAVDGALWVAVRGTVTSHIGGTLRAQVLAPITDVDPRSSYDVLSARILHLIGDGLLAFELLGGTTPRLVPDLALSIPQPTDGGRTYIFQLRSGIHYSNGEVVAPSDFRYALERGFALNRAAHRSLFIGLVGGDACADDPRTCNLERGVVADDGSGTVTFHLVHADPDFPSKLTMPFAYPAPPSVPASWQGRAGVPGTGPYMLEGPLTKHGITLVRNPEFEVWSQAAQPGGYVDRIEMTFGVPPKTQVEAVEEGTADLAMDAAASGSLDELLVRSPAQIHSSAQSITIFAVLNGEVPPFDELDARRAVNLAIDRDRVVEIFGGEEAAVPTCQQIPPNFPGYRRYCPYTADPDPSGAWTGPDLEEAKRLVRRSGTVGTRVLFEYIGAWWDPQGARLGTYMVELLTELGHRASVRSVPIDEFYDPDHGFQMAFDAFGADYPSASNFISDRFNCAASWTPSPHLCDPSIDALIDRAARMPNHDPAASGELWSEIDRAIVDQAPYLWFMNLIAVEFVSERVGNYQWSTQWGGLLDQLWVR
jgi:YVTN family beta-propeller protein